MEQPTTTTAAATANATHARASTLSLTPTTVRDANAMLLRFGDGDGGGDDEATDWTKRRRPNERDEADIRELDEAVKRVRAAVEKLRAKRGAMPSTHEHDDGNANENDDNEDDDDDDDDEAKVRTYRRSVGAAVLAKRSRALNLLASSGSSFMDAYEDEDRPLFHVRRWRDSGVLPETRTAKPPRHSGPTRRPRSSLSSSQDLSLIHI